MDSNIVSYFKNQTTSIFETMNNRALFVENYEDIINNKIEAINTQLKTYYKTSLNAIKSEIYQEIIQNINFDDEREKIKTLLRKRDVEALPKFEHKNIHIPKFPIGSRLNDVSVDYINAVYMNNDDLKKYARNISKFKHYINNYTNKIETFENNMIEYKNNVKRILEQNVDYIKTAYIHYLFKLMNKNNVDETFKINEKLNVSYDKKYETFFKNTIKEMLK